MPSEPSRLATQISSADLCLPSGKRSGGDKDSGCIIREARSTATEPGLVCCSRALPSFQQNSSPRDDICQ